MDNLNPGIPPSKKTTSTLFQIAPPSRNRMEVLNQIFDELALKDQQAYYRKKIDRNRRAAGQVNMLRAGAAFVGGVASAAIALVAANGTNGGTLIDILVLLAVISPGIGAAFASLNSIFEWDRLVAVYKKALESIYLTDAVSPIVSMDDMTYFTHLRAYSDAALDVMREETGQFGNLVRSSQQIQDFLEKSRQRAEAHGFNYFATDAGGEITNGNAQG
jgi:hypothetical protein